MWPIRETRRRARRILGPAAAALVFGYFLIHAFVGDYGILAWRQLHQRVAGAEAALLRAEAIRVRLEGRVRLLRSESLDPDMLDERARIEAGLAHPDDVVILLPVPGRGGAGDE